jgi:gliding motility-associated-like protein
MNLRKKILLLTLLSLLAIGQTFATDFYWVGNSGNWNDPIHWSNTSGGNGGVGIPTENDNVFIDKKSFKKQSEINIIGRVNCKNFSWTNTKEAALNGKASSELIVNGSYEVNTTFSNNFFGKTTFTTDKSTTQLDFDKSEFLGHVEFNGTGSWNLKSDLITADSNYIYLKQGELLVSNVTIFSGGIDATSNQTKTLNLDNAVIYNHNKAIFNSPQFELINKNSTFAINNFAAEISIGNVLKNDITYSNHAKKTNTCGTIPFTITTFVLTDFNGSGVSCQDTCDGIVYADVTGGTGNFTYLWLAAGTPGTFPGDTLFNACQGNVGIQVTDEGQNIPFGETCTDQIFISNPIALAVNLSSIGKPKCNGDCDGFLGVAVNFGTSPYQISWAQVPDITSNISNLCGLPGGYDITVTDTNGCTVTKNFLLTQPDPITFTLDSTNITCFGANNGDATVSNIAGGNPPNYTLSWSTPPGGASNPITNLTPGVYVATVSDDSLCFNMDSVTITESPKIQVDTSSTLPTCGGDADGTASAKVTSGGSGPFTHNWSTGFSETVPESTSSTIVNLTTGNYCDTIVDFNGCDTIICFTITEPDSITSTTTVTDVICNGACNGTAKTLAAGGSTPYTYAWDSIPNAGGFTTFDSIADLCPGTYFVTVTDVLLCSFSDTVVVTEPLPIIINPSSTDITCNGINNGTATASPSGGTGNPTIDFTYSWSGPACKPTPGNTPTISSLCAGTYTVTVTDSAGCIATTNVTIVDPLPLTLTMSFIGETCAGNCDGSAFVSATGGTGNPDIDFTYSWAPDPTISNGQGTDSIFNLCANTYTVTVNDSNNCSENNNVTIIPLPSITPNLDTTDLSCNAICNGTATVQPTGNGPFSVSWNGAAAINIPPLSSNTITGLCAGAHTALLTDNNNCTLLVNFTINEPLALTTITTPTDISCFGLCDGNVSTNAVGGSGTLTYAWDGIPTGFIGSGQGTDSIFDLCAGTYYVMITDDSLCTINDTNEIFAPNEIFPNATSTNISCSRLNDATALSTPTGGSGTITSIIWRSLPELVILPGNPIGPLGIGQYEVTVTDDNGCIGMDTVTITDPTPLTVDAQATGAICGNVCDGSALATPTGGTPGTTGYSYSWNTSPTNQTTQTATDLCVGEYEVTVTDSMGCTAQDTTVITPLIQITINATTVNISCNGVCDGTAQTHPTGGTEPYSYLWESPVTPNNLDSATGLCPGYVVVTVTDSLGCTLTDSIDMPVGPNVLLANGIINQQISCNGFCDAEVAHSPSGGTAPYTSVWSPSGIDTNNVCAPNAVITVTDFSGCIASDTLIILDPDSIVGNPVVANVNCFGDSTGSITLSPTGGAGAPYNYVWTGPVIGSGSSTNNLPTGTYTITISDNNGCFVVVTETVTEEPLLSAIPTGNDMSCNGVCDGMMAVIVNGGVAPYTYAWVNNQPLVAPFDTISNICPTPASNLSNSVTITDDKGCSILQNVIIINPELLDANVSGTGILCNNECNGTAQINPTGGTGAYSVLWSPFAPPVDSNQITGLCSGNYLATVTDDNGCLDTMTYTVNSLLVLAATLDSTNVTCNGNNDGTATANITGGTLPYSISWTGPCTPEVTDTNFIDNLCPGVYTVTISDFNGCPLQASIIIEEPQLLTDSTFLTPANCGVSDGSICLFPDGGTPPYNHSWSNGEITNCITNLPAAFYTDTVTDFNGCISIIPVGLSNPGGPSGVTATVNDATCFGSCTGSINVIVIGGTPTFDYSWTGPNGFTGTDSTETGLCKGIYNLTVTDSIGCILATNLVVGQADSITENSTYTDASCNGLCDGTASVTPTGGTAPYTFLWSNNGSTGSSASNLCTGALNVTITDFNGCQKIVSFTINNPNTLTITSNTTHPTCNTICDGTATANPVGGTSPFTYQWNDLASQTGKMATGLCDGTYIVTVTDFNGCAENDTVTITQPSSITANTITIQSTCGNSDGSADVCGSTGGTGIHTYLWTDVTGNPTSCNVTGLAAGTYTVEITDANLCTTPFLITISDMNGPDVAVTVTNASCDGLCDGQASASATGFATLSYEWQTGGQTTPTVTGLCAGNYTVEVTDGNGCKTTEPATIIDNTEITAIRSTVNITCNSDCDGSASVTPSGGVPPYRYSWIGGNAAGQTINAVGGLCAGNYTVTITDFVGCSLTQDVVITEPDILAVTIAGTAANCNGSCDGQAISKPTGGTAPFTYSWSNGASTSTITALCAGDYTVTITDFNGCRTQNAITIGEGVAITASINPTNTACGVCDGAVTVIGGGGSGAPYTYSWAITGSTNATITNLCPGAYLVNVSDNLGCTEQFNALVNNINGPTLLTLSDSVSCFGTCDGLAYTSITGGTPTYTFQWDDPLLQTHDSASAICAGLYNVVVQDGLGCITVDTVSVLEPQEIIANITFTNPSCPTFCDGTATVTPSGGIGTLVIDWGANAANQATPTATGLCAGQYFVTLTDDNGCSQIDSITLSDPTAISITASASLPTCFGDCDGTAIANASGGTPGYQYSWNTAPVQTNSLIGGLCATNPNYIIITVTDNNGCTALDSVQITNPPVLSTTSTPINPTCNGTCDGSITMSPTGGVQPYTYTWNNGSTTASIANLCAGTYEVLIVDFNNCSINDTITLTETTLDPSITPTTPSCGVCNGSITSTPVGVGPFDFVWTNAVNPTPVLQTDNNAANSTINGLCAGTYNLQINDQFSGCTTDYLVTLNNTSAPSLALTSTNESCINSCDGTATVIATGGILPYTYSWIPAVVPTDTLATTTNLCGGLYTITVTDSNNCISSDTITINTTGLTLTLTSVVPESCFGDCNGSATVIANGGSPNYNYSWNPTGQITPQATGLCVGTYVATVTDAANCKDSISTTIIGPDELIVVASENSPITCNGLSNGNLIATVVGGNPNYLYSWNTTPVQTTQIATNLGAGTYIVTVLDDKGCSAMDTIVLTEPDSILDNSTSIAPACGACDGSIQLVPTGGSGAYSYSWITPLSPPQTPALNTATIINLCAGAYTIMITDNVSGCNTDFSYALSNTNGPDPNTTVTHPTCNGVCDGQIVSNPIGTAPPYAFAWNPNGTSNSITSLCASTYELTVTDTNGCVGIAIDDVIEPAVLLANITATNINCNGLCDGTVTANTTGGTPNYNYSWTSVPSGTHPTDSNLTALCPGTYIVTITDTKACSVIDSVSISEPTALSSVATQINATCISNCDGAATITPSGGIGTYTFEWNGNTTPGQGNTLTGLCVGLTEIEIFDQQGCSFMDSVFISATDSVYAYAGIDTNYCLGTPITLNGIPGGDYTNVEWFELPSMTSLGTTDTIITTPTVIGTICYAFQATGTCTIIDTVCITVDALPPVNAGEDVVIFENGNSQLNATGGVTYSWTPSEGLSDSTISNPIAIPSMTTTYIVTITSANGCSASDSIVVTVLPLINYSDGITPNSDGTNDVWIIDYIEQYPDNVVEIYNRWGELLFHADGYQQNWDGTYNGKKLPIGTYYFIIDLNDETIEPVTGPITILR